MTEQTPPGDRPPGTPASEAPLLAEALAQRAFLQRSVSDLTRRAVASTVYGEGETPPEDVNALLVQIAGQITQLGQLIAAINQANTASFLPDGMSLTDALAARDALDLRMKCLREITDAAAGTTGHGRGFGYRRISRSEIPDRTDVDIPARRAELDSLARTRRELDLAIQQANWTTRLGG